MTVPLKSFNVGLGVLGHVGTGKSYRLQREAERYARSCYVVASDPTGSFSGPGVTHHATVPELLRAFRERPAGLHCLTDVDAMQAVHAALAVAAAARSQAVEGRAVPTLLVVDEVVGTTGMSPSYMHPELARAWFQRRHLHLGIAWGSQRPQSAHPALYEYANRLLIFRSPSRVCDRLKELDIPEDVLSRIPSLPDRRYYDYSPGRPPVLRGP